METMNWSQGCIRRTQLSCQGKDKDGFLKFGGLKLPDATNSWVSKNMSIEECRIKCFKIVNVWLIQIQISEEEVVAVPFGMEI